MSLGPHGGRTRSTARWFRGEAGLALGLGRISLSAVHRMNLVAHAVSSRVFCKHSTRGAKSKMSRIAQQQSGVQPLCHCALMFSGLPSAQRLAAHGHCQRCICALMPPSQCCRHPIASAASLRRLQPVCTHSCCVCCGPPPVAAAANICTTSRFGIPPSAVEGRLPLACFRPCRHG